MWYILWHGCTSSGTYSGMDALRVVHTLAWMHFEIEDVVGLGRSGQKVGAHAAIDLHTAGRNKEEDIVKLSQI